MRLRCPCCASTHDVPLPDGGVETDEEPLRGAAVRCQECGTAVDYYVLALE